MLAIINASYEKSITHSYYDGVQNQGMNAAPFADFARRFIAACREARLPTQQDQLGRLFAVSAPMISYYSTGKKLPSMETALHIAQKTGVCVEWLLTGRGPRYPGPDMNPDDWLDLRGLSEDVINLVQAGVKAARDHRDGSG